MKLKWMGLRGILDFCNLFKLQKGKSSDASALPVRQRRFLPPDKLSAKPKWYIKPADREGCYRVVYEDLGLSSRLSSILHDESISQDPNLQQLLAYILDILCDT